MSYYVYILECKDGSLYTGITWNLNKRIKEHFKGASKYTRSKLPVKLVYFEKCNDKIDAAKREREIKGWSRKKKLILVNNSGWVNNSLRRAARSELAVN
ncbi:MAG TPA: GIY-YIG nuclease family protein [Candidatus Nanoarchaeia archaeon]